MIAYLLLVQSGPSNSSSLSLYAFASVGMQEEVGGTTVVGDLVCAASEMDGRFFQLTLMPVAVGKTKQYGWEGEASCAMLLDVGRRLVEFEGVWLGVGIILHNGWVSSTCISVHSKTQ